MLLRYKGNLAETDRTLLLEFARVKCRTFVFAR